MLRSSISFKALIANGLRELFNNINKTKITKSTSA